MFSDSRGSGNHLYQARYRVFFNLLPLFVPLFVFSLKAMHGDDCETPVTDNIAVKGCISDCPPGYYGVGHCCTRRYRDHRGEMRCSGYGSTECIKRTGQDPPETSPPTSPDQSDYLMEIFSDAQPPDNTYIPDVGSIPPSEASLRKAARGTLFVGKDADNAAPFKIVSPFDFGQFPLPDTPDAIFKRVVALSFSEGRLATSSDQIRTRDWSPGFEIIDGSITPYRVLTSWSVELMSGPQPPKYPFEKYLSGIILKPSLHTDPKRSKKLWTAVIKLRDCEGRYLCVVPYSTCKVANPANTSMQFNCPGDVGPILRASAGSGMDLIFTKKSDYLFILEKWEKPHFLSIIGDEPDKKVIWYQLYTHDGRSIQVYK